MTNAQKIEKLAKETNANDRPEIEHYNKIKNVKGILEYLKEKSRADVTVTILEKKKEHLSYLTNISTADNAFKDKFYAEVIAKYLEDFDCLKEVELTADGAASMKVNDFFIPLPLDVEDEDTTQTLSGDEFLEYTTHLVKFEEEYVLLYLQELREQQAKDKAAE